MQKAIIWDFDGVVADTEKLWMEIELDVLNKYCNLNWDFATIVRYLSGQGLSTQRLVLAELGIFPPASMWEEVGYRCYNRIIEGFDPTPGVRDVLELPYYKCAMATGGEFHETLLKLKAIGLQDFFDEKNLVTIDMVKQGKPNPDPFLLAAEKIDMKPEDCYVVEDSEAGLIAATRAGMTPVCFLGSEMYKSGNNIPEAIKSLNIKHVFYNMYDVKDFFVKEFMQNKNG